jgi:four helix bundle protein
MRDEGEGGRGKGEGGGWRVESGTVMKERTYAGCEPWKFDGEKWIPENPRQRKQIRSYRDLDVYNLAYSLAMGVFHLTARFPKEERYALTDQLRRSSRSVCANIREGFAKRRYENVFKNKLNDSLGESEETSLWVDFSLDCGVLRWAPSIGGILKKA